MKVFWLRKQGTVRAPQCEMPLDSMSATVSYNPNYRERYQRRGLDPNFCVRKANVSVEGKHFCNSHAGQILLRKLAGPEPNRRYDLDE